MDILAKVLSVLTAIKDFALPTSETSKKVLASILAVCLLYFAIDKAITGVFDYMTASKKSSVEAELATAKNNLAEIQRTMLNNKEEMARLDKANKEMESELLKYRGDVAKTKTKGNNVTKSKEEKDKSVDIDSGYKVDVNYYCLPKTKYDELSANNIDAIINMTKGK